MVISKEYNFINIFGFSLLCLILWALPIVAMAETDADSFYGNQSLNSVVDGEKMTLTLPGGAKVAMENQETAYTVPDHTQSTRLVVEADNTVSEPIAYTPFGDSQETNEIKLIGHYTGMTFEPETATYDYHARNYDPSIARFTGVDAIRQSISPYSYTANNPINFVDPNGLGKVTFWLYSSTLAPDSAKSARVDINYLDLPVIVLALENRQSIEDHPLLLRKDSKPVVKHLIVNVDGQDTKSGSLFAKDLYKTLLRSYPKATKEVESIFLHGCGLICGPNDSEEHAFAGKFVDFALSSFPKLKSVFVSPYRVDIWSGKYDNTTTNIDASFIGDDKHKIRFKVSTRDYYEGNPESSLKKLFEPPNPDTVFSVIDRIEGLQSPIVEDSDVGYMSDFINKWHNFREPVFRRLGPPPLPPRPTSLVLPQEAPPIPPKLAKPRLQI